MMTEKVRPITPDDVTQEHAKNIPSAVIEVFNQLIAQNYVCGSATFERDDVIALLVGRDFDRQEIFDKDWLNIEKLYESAGWDVTYDKPGYNESYSATFRFERLQKLYSNP